MDNTPKKILSIILGYILVEYILKSCNNFHVVRA